MLCVIWAVGLYLASGPPDLDRFSFPTEEQKIMFWTVLVVGTFFQVGDRLLQDFRYFLNHWEPTKPLISALREYREKLVAKFTKPAAIGLVLILTAGIGYVGVWLPVDYLTEFYHLEIEEQGVFLPLHEHWVTGIVFALFHDHWPELFSNIYIFMGFWALAGLSMTWASLSFLWKDLPDILRNR